MSTSNTTLLLQTTSITLSLLGAGGIASISLFDVPLLQSQPASRSLPSIRWLFSRGSHVFPTVAFLSGGGFGALAVRALPAGLLQLGSSSSSWGQLLFHVLLLGRGGAKTNGYLAAGLLCLSIGPVTGFMVPNNFAFIKMNAEKGGLRSDRAARNQLSSNNNTGGRSRTAADSVRGEGEGDEFTDLSGPQEKTRENATREEDDEVRERLAVFGRQNVIRALLMAAGGIVGLLTALL